MNFAGDIKGRARVDIVRLLAQQPRPGETRRPYPERPPGPRSAVAGPRGLHPAGPPGRRLRRHRPDDRCGRLSDIRRRPAEGDVRADLVVPAGHGPAQASRRTRRGEGRHPAVARWAHMDYTDYAAHKWVGLDGGLERPGAAPLSALRSSTRPGAASRRRRRTTPLALCDASTIKTNDCITFDACLREPFDEPGNQFESQLCPYDPGQRWFYFPDLTPDELIVFKSFDSDQGARRPALAQLRRHPRPARRRRAAGEHRGPLLRLLQLGPSLRLISTRPNSRNRL